MFLDMSDLLTSVFSKYQIMWSWPMHRDYMSMEFVLRVDGKVIKLRGRQSLATCVVISFPSVPGKTDQPKLVQIISAQDYGLGKYAK